MVEADPEDDSRKMEPIAKTPRSSQRTALRSIVALISLIVIALYVVATENTTIEKRTTTVAPVVEKRILSDDLGNASIVFKMPDVVQSLTVVTPVVVEPAVVPVAVVVDGPLPGECCVTRILCV